MVVVEKFETIEKLVATLKARDGKNNEGLEGRRSSEEGTERFTGTASYKEACDQIANGWDKHLKEVRDQFDKEVRVKTNTMTEKARVSTGVVGYAPLVPNAIRGLPNSMITTNRVPQKVKAVTIVYNTSVSSGWTTKTMIKCGIAVLKLVNKLELKGYRVKISVEGIASYSGTTHCRMLVDVKDWKQPLDLKKLCFPLISPSMLRRISMKWLETVPNMTETGFRNGYGYPLCGDGTYESDVETAKKDKVIGSNEYYLTCYMIKANEYDIDAIMKQTGMSKLN